MVVSALQKGIKVLVNPSQEYFDQFQEWISETERWNYRSAEYKLWLSTFDKFWMFIAIEEETDEIVCAVSVALQHDTDGDALYSIGNYYCVPEWRGKGVGSKVFAMANKLIGSENATLYGAVQMSPLYAERYHFSLMHDFWHMFGDIEAKNLVIPARPAGLVCKRVDEHDWDTLHRYDETICPLNRRKFMKLNLMCAGSTSRMVCNASGRIMGFGCIKQATADELVLSPLYADSYDAAVALISDLLKAIPNLNTMFSSLVTIYPDVNNDVPRILSLISNNRFETTRAYRNQYTKKMLKFPHHRIFANDEVSHSPV